VHRDLKPENVLIVKGVPMIADFGLGRRIDPNTVDLTRSHMMMGTLAYMAPEQFTDAKRVGPPADVYALGKVLWEMLAGRRPSVGRPALDEVPDEYRSFIDRCTQERETDRYASATDAMKAFRLLVGGPGEESYAGADFEEQLRLWAETLEGEDSPIIGQIARTLVSRRDDEELFFQAVPRLDPLLISQLLQQQPSEFDVIIRSYNRHIQGNLPFDYCDVAANFYKRVFDETTDRDQKAVLLGRLIEMGPTHNRWHVGDVVADVLESIKSRSIAEMAADLLRENERYARWNKDYIGNRTLAEPIARVLADLDPPPDAPS
jgi:serine/threonine protein kinase